MARLNCHIGWHGLKTTTTSTTTTTTKAILIAAYRDHNAYECRRRSENAGNNGMTTFMYCTSSEESEALGKVIDL